MGLILKLNFCFDVNKRFVTTGMVTHLFRLRAFVDLKYRLELTPKGRKRGWKDTLKVVRFFMEPEEEEQDVAASEESSDDNYSGTGKVAR